MSDWLQQTIDRIESDDLLSKSFFTGLDADSALDTRDHDPFDSAWVEASEQIDAAWEHLQVNDRDRELLETIREVAFLKVSNATMNHEIAGYVSDDFEMIARSRLLEETHDFIEKLWDSYNQGEFPTQ